MISIIDDLGPRPDHPHALPGPRSIKHSGLRVRLTLGIISVRIAELLEDRLRRAAGADLDLDDIARGAGDIR